MSPGAAAPVPVPVRAATSNPLGKGSLGRTIVNRVVLIIAIIAVTLSALSYFQVRSSMISRLDENVLANATRDFKPVERTTTPPSQLGKTFGAITVTVDKAGGITGVILVSDNGTPTTTGLSDRVLQALLDVPRDNQIHTVRLPGLGDYRVFAGDATPAPQPPGGVATKRPDLVPAYVVSGLPMTETQRQLVTLVIFEAVLTLLAILAAILVLRPMVRRALQPLSTLADTALEVSELELDHGRVDLDVRADTAGSVATSEVGRLSTAFNTMLDHVQEALTAREASEQKVRKFVADASHELRNPLASIRGYAEITRRQRDELPPDAAFAMGRIESESERMSSLVEDMLLLARLDNKRALDVVDVDLTEQLIHAVSDARVAGPEHHWELALPEEPVVVRADADRLYQVIVNLLTNARVHTPAGTHVVASLRTDDRLAEIVIADTGPGIDPQLLPRIFERFTRAEESRVRHGQGSTGLGLAIVRSVITSLGGTVRVDSVPGDTRFTIQLPLATG